jgi:hypothetical protein
VLRRFHCRTDVGDHPEDGRLFTMSVRRKVAIG